jgi:hypothetical protein
MVEGGETKEILLSGEDLFAIELKHEKQCKGPVEYLMSSEPDTYKKVDSE